MSLLKDALDGRLEAVRSSLESGDSVDAPDADGTTPLMAAAQGGHLEIVKALLGRNASLGAADKFGGTALMAAAQAGHADIVRELIRAGSDVEQKESAGWTALMLAAQSGREEAVAALLGASADPNAADADGVTALMLAARKGNASVVRALAGAGADASLRDKKGRTALAYAMEKQNAAAAEAVREAAAFPKSAQPPEPRKSAPQERGAVEELAMRPAPKPVPAEPERRPETAAKPQPRPEPKPEPEKVPEAARAEPPAPHRLAPRSEDEEDPALRFLRTRPKPKEDPLPADPVARARKLLDKGEARRALESLTRDAISKAASSSEKARVVAAAVARSGETEEFVRKNADAPKEFLSAYARAFMAEGEFKTSLALFRNVPLARLTVQDELDIAELQLELGDDERARLLLSRLLKARPLAEDLERYYGLARLAEDRGCGRAAALVYAEFGKRRDPFRDTADRLARLRSGEDAGAPAGSAPPPAAAAPSEEKVLLHRYKLGKKVGEGGMGIVYEGYDLNLKRVVAVKRMTDELAVDERMRERFLREATIIARLTHPYIVAIHDVLALDEGIYLVFEFVDGRSLAQVLWEKRRLSPAECWKVMAYVCPAIEHAHKNNVLHRDLKPGNVMLDGRGFVKVMDFGLAREAMEASSRLTHKEIMGTPAYMAPEHHLGETVAASDIFSLGVMFYEMLTGELPFKGPDFLAQKERRKFAPPSALVKGLPPNVDAAVAAALDPDPAKRPKSALDFLARLKGMA